MGCSGTRESGLHPGEGVRSTKALILNGRKSNLQRLAKKPSYAQTVNGQARRRL